MPTKNPIQMIRTMSPTTDYPTPVSFLLIDTSVAPLCKHF
jgi:hypothetical protein